jgi:hypothetical protein
MESRVNIESFGHDIHEYQSEGVGTPFALLLFIGDAFGRLVKIVCTRSFTDLDPDEIESYAVPPGVDLTPIIPIRGVFLNFTDPVWLRAFIINGFSYDTPQFIDDGETRYVWGYAFVSLGEFGLKHGEEINFLENAEKNNGYYQINTR